MKDGVYINLCKDNANLLVITDGKLDDGEAVGILDYSVSIKMKGEDTIVLTFAQLEYLGAL